MLRVRIDGHEVETTPISLAKLVFDGKADRHSPSRSSGEIAEQALEQSLGSVHCEALTSELHRRLQLMYSTDSSAVDVQQLRTQVGDLCQWRWAYPHIAARFFWAAAWLTDLMDRLESAVSLYDAFLQMPFRESHLRLLALNNRGVLRIRLGRLEGVQDLACAAIPQGGLKETHDAHPQSARHNPQSLGLPAACFNLLNLVNVALGTDELTRAVDEELADFFVHLPDDLKMLWLGEAPGWRPQIEGPDASNPALATSNEDLLILRDPTYRRLNLLTTRLAAQARGLAAEGDLRLETSRPTHTGTAGYSASQTRRANDRAPSLVCRLSLWDCHVNGDNPGAANTGHDGERLAESRHQGCAEAASLLLSDDIPSTLMRQESPLARAEQSALEELADIESHLTLDRCELAKSRLHAQRGILSSLNRRGRFAGLLARVDAQLERIADLEAQNERIEIQRACAMLVSQVETFCTLTDLCRAERESHDLDRRLQQFRARLASWTDPEVWGLLDELAGRMQRYMSKLRRLEIRKQIRDPLQHVRQSWPADWTVPVPESVVQALAQCRFHDPENWMEDWDALQEQLDAHQGRYHAQRALSALRLDPASRDQVQDDLARALSCSPDLWSTISPLFELPSQPAVDQAGRLLEKALQQSRADSKKCLRLWQGVETTLSSMLAKGDVEAVSRVRTLAETYLDHCPVGLPHWPGRADPRNPVNLFLESCDKARCLIEAEQSLDARPPRLTEATSRLARVLRSGPDTRDQLKRVVRGLYLAEFHDKDATQVQRQTLTELESWVEAMPEEASRQVREQDIMQAIGKVRTGVSAGRSPAAAHEARPGGSESDGNERRPLAGGSGDGDENQEAAQVTP